jgi:hypothetical protein
MYQSKYFPSMKGGENDNNSIEYVRMLLERVLTEIRAIV